MGDSYWTRKRLSRRRVLGAAGVGAAGLATAAVIGCGEEEEGAPPAATGTAVAGQPVYGGQFVLAYWDIDSIDPYSDITAFQGQYNTTFLYDQLLTSIPTDPDDVFASEIVPELAESLPEQPDQVTYIFKLRPGVKLHDKAPVNGRTLTAQDVVANLEKAKTKITGYAGPTRLFIESARAADGLTVELKTARPFAGFLADFADPPWFSIVAAEVLDDAETNPIGTGPYLLDALELGVRVRLARNPDYFQAGLPYYDAFEYRVSNDSSDWIARAIAGENDWIKYAPPASEEALRQGNPDLVILHVLRDLTFYEAWNINRTPLDDVRVRQALALGAPSHQEIIDAAWRGLGLSHGVIPSTNPFAVPIAELPYIDKQDVATAKQLLAAAGYPDGFTFVQNVSIDYLQESDGELVVADAWQRNLGVVATRNELLWGGGFAVRESGDFTAAIIWSDRSNDPTRYLSYYLPEHAIGSAVGYGDEELWEKIRAQMGEFDEEKRREAVRELQLTLAERQYFYYPPTPGDYEAHQVNVQNWLSSTQEYAGIRWGGMRTWKV